MRSRKSFPRNALLDTAGEEDVFIRLRLLLHVNWGASIAEFARSDGTTAAAVDRYT